MTPKHFPCTVFYGPAEWHHEGLRFGCSYRLCLTEMQWAMLASSFGACHYRVRAIAYYTVADVQQ